MNKKILVPRSGEVEDFEKQVWWKTFYMVVLGGILCRHKYWVSGGYGAYCWRCLVKVEPSDER